MELRVKTELLQADRSGHIERAADLLRAGQTVAFPTETVYGLGANALMPTAVEQIFRAKQRPHWDPLIVHVADYEMLARVAGWSATGAATEEKLLRAFWPGPLTLLLPRTAAVSDAVTAGRPLVGVRMPAHPVALALIRAAGVPIAAPSANTFGHTSPTTAQHVLDDLEGRIAAVLDGGPTNVGLESTVAQVVPDGVIVYRPGAIGIGDIERAVGHDWVRMYVPEDRPVQAFESLPSPGVGLRHYAPRASLVLVEEGIARSPHLLELSLVDPIDRAFDGTETIGVMLPDGWSASCAQLTFQWGPWHDVDILAQRLYTGLRDLDQRGATTIICPVPEHGGMGDALRDRLSKAARIAT